MTDTLVTPAGAERPLVPGSGGRELTRQRLLRTVGPGLAVVAVQLALFPMPPGAWLQGAVLGLLNALVALGLMLVWRAHRVLNFGQADMGTFPAALAVGLILLSGAGYLAGLAVGLVTAVVIGAGIETLVIRRFFRAPRLLLTVATIGVSQFFIVAALLVPRLWGEDLLVGENGRSAYGFPLRLTFEVGQQVFHADDVVAAVVSVACLAVVGLLLRRSDIGVAVRASADRVDRAAMLGVPVRRLQTAVWVVASVLSFLGVFLQGAILGFPLNATVGLTALVTALAALALGGFGELPTIAVAAVAVGVLNKGVAWNNSSRPTVVYAVLAAVVVVALLVRRVGRRRADADPVSSWQASAEARPVPAELRRRPEVVGARLLLTAAVAVLAATLPVWLSPSQEFEAATLAAFAVVALSIVVLTGWAGEVTLGQMAFAAVGAVAGALATAEWGLDLSVAFVVAGLSGAVAAVVVGIPSLRFHGVFLAVTTLAFGLAATGYLLNPTEFSWIPAGRIDRPPLFGVWDITGPAAMYEVSLGVLVLCLLAVRGLRRSRSGRVLRAMRDNERAAGAYGVPANRTKVVAFAVSGALAGVAGCLLVHLQQGYDVAVFAPQESINVFTAAVVGGVATSVGALLGAVFLLGSRWLLSGNWQLLPSAVGVLVVLLVLPGGLGEVLFRLRDRALRRLATLRHLAVPALGDRDRRRRSPSGWRVGSVDVGDRRWRMGTGRTGQDGPSATPGPGPVDGAGPSQLEVRSLSVAYGGVQVLFGVDFDVAPGEIVALLGTNGAGKSTLLRAIGGTAPVTGGAVTLDGQDITGHRPERIAALGVSQMPGGQGVFPSLTVEENLRVAGWLQRRQPGVHDQRAAEVYDRFEVLARRRDDPAADLSGGQQQMLALGMALLARPRLLLVDELSLGLAPLVVEQLLAVVREIRDQGTTVVLVEQSVNLALTVADRAYFMEKGEMRFSGAGEELLDRPDLVRAVFLHGAAERVHAARPHPDTGDRPREPATPALAVSGLSVSFGGIRAVHQVDLAVGRHEIVGVIGPNGAGKTTLFDLVSGFVAAGEGTVALHGVDLTHRSAAVRARLGLGRSFQDSRLFPALTVEETIAVALERWIEVGDPLNAMVRSPALQDTEAAVRRRVDELIELVGVEAFRSKFLHELSTGSRRLVDLACTLGHAPTVVLLDEPSSGIAQREAEALAPLLRRIRDELGAALVVVEHDMGLITSVADRLVALDQGAVVATGSAEEVLGHPDVVAAYLGSDPAAVQRSGAPARLLKGASTQ